jgi:hypothetical protein
VTPCLLTWEAPEVSAWLRALVAGRVEPETAENFDHLIILEPNISLGLESRSENSARIRLHFSAESLAPWDAGEAESLVVVTASFEELLRAADQWDSESAAFPRR